MRTTLGTTQRAALALGGAATIALLGVSAPAQAAGHAHGHATGSDNRSTSLKDGQGHNDSWQAQSDPDGDENGGVDQPGGQGGVDTSDQDGNNGSGNDSDCEDDNRGKGVPGHCKDKDDEPSSSEENPSTGGSTGSTGETPADQGTADEENQETPSTGGATGSDETDETDATGEIPAAEGTKPVVLGVERTEEPAGTAGAEGSAAAAGRTPAQVAVRDQAAAVLPNTGADATTLALLAGGLGAIAAGTVLVRRRQVADQA